MSALFGSSKRDDDGDWLSVSDLMAGLMVIFLFIAIVFIRPLAEENSELKEQREELKKQAELLEEQKEELRAQRELLRQQNTRITEIAVAWQEGEANIFRELQKEFANDLNKWNAEIEQDTLIFRFKSPDVLFAEGQSAIRPQFKEILTDFFPRYIRVLSDFQPSLEEIRIEGHTSSEWNRLSPAAAYYENMRLSQARTREVLGFVLTLPAVSDDREWIRSLLTANGLSSSRIVLNESGQENPELSRRVEFRVRTQTRSEIKRILAAENEL